MKIALCTVNVQTVLFINELAIYPGRDDVIKYIDNRLVLRRRLTNALLKNLAVDEYQFYDASIDFITTQTRPNI